MLEFGFRKPAGAPVTGGSVTDFTSRTATRPPLDPAQRQARPYMYLPSAALAATSQAGRVSIGELPRRRGAMMCRGPTLENRRTARARLGAGVMVATSFLLGGCARATPPSCDDQTVRVRVADTAWALPAFPRPTLPDGAYLRGRNQERCPLAGRREITADFVSVLGESPARMSVQPPPSVLVLVRAVPDPQCAIGDVPALKGQSHVVPDDAAERAGLHRRDLGPLRIFEPSGTTNTFGKIVCTQLSVSPGPRPGPFSPCTAYFEESPRTVVEVHVFEPTWRIEQSKPLFDRVQQYLEQIRLDA